MISTCWLVLSFIPLAVVIAVLVARRLERPIAKADRKFGGEL